MAKIRTTIESGNHVLDARLFTPTTEPTGSGVLLVHGFGSRGRVNEQYAKKMSQQGITSLTFDLSGHGDSTGTIDDISVNQHLADVRAAYDYLAGNTDAPVDHDRLGLAGMSYGGYLATLLTVERPAKSLLTRSAPLYPDRLFDEPRCAYTNEEALNSEPDANNTALQAVAYFTGRICLVTCEFDSVIPTATADAYAQAAPGSSQFILTGAQHSLDSDAQQQFQPILQAWAAEL